MDVGLKRQLARSISSKGPLLYHSRGSVSSFSVIWELEVFSSWDVQIEILQKILNSLNHRKALLRRANKPPERLVWQRKGTIYWLSNCPDISTPGTQLIKPPAPRYTWEMRPSTSFLISMLLFQESAFLPMQMGSFSFLEHSWLFATDPHAVPFGAW